MTALLNIYHDIGTNVDDNHNIGKNILTLVAFCLLNERPLMSEISFTYQELNMLL
jgi:hypothetical protein